MSLAHDIFSETNPGFGAVALHAFATAYASIDARGPELAAIYMVLPLALSADLASCFDATNKNTGLLVWIERNPKLLVETAERVNLTLSVTTSALQTACFTGLLELGENARLLPAAKTIKGLAKLDSSNEAHMAVNRAKRLGYWFGDSRSARNAFAAFGVGL